jgi:hypothetical protein
MKSGTLKGFQALDCGPFPFAGVRQPRYFTAVEEKGTHFSTPLALINM